MINVVDKETRACLDRCSVLVSGFLWLIIKVMPNNWIKYSEDTRSTYYWILTKIEDYITGWLDWDKKCLWHIYLVPIIIEILADKRSGKTLLLHNEFKSK